MRIACHQPNFIPWLPFFYKMAMVDLFIILANVQFEKNGYQNRYQLSSGRWITKPVENGNYPIIDKHFSDGKSLLSVNMAWILSIKHTLGIKTEIRYDYKTELTQTARLVELIKKYEGSVYITSPEAKDKYLNEDFMRKSGIGIEYCKVPKNLKIHTFEAFEKWGIDGTIKQLPKRQLCEV